MKAVTFLKDPTGTQLEELPPEKLEALGKDLVRMTLRDQAEAEGGRLSPEAIAKLTFGIAALSAVNLELAAVCLEALDQEGGPVANQVASFAIELITAETLTPEAGPVLLWQKAISAQVCPPGNTGEVTAWREKIRERGQSFVLPASSK